MNELPGQNLSVGWMRLSEGGDGDGMGLREEENGTGQLGRCASSGVRIILPPQNPLPLPLIYYCKLVFLTLVGLKILELKLPGYPK